MLKIIRISLLRRDLPLLASSLHNLFKLPLLSNGVREVAVCAGSHYLSLESQAKLACFLSISLDSAYRFDSVPLFRHFIRRHLISDIANTAGTDAALELAKDFNTSIGSRYPGRKVFSLTQDTAMSHALCLLQAFNMFGDITVEDWSPQTNPEPTEPLSEERTHILLATLGKSLKLGKSDEEAAQAIPDSDRGSAPHLSRHGPKMVGLIRTLYTGADVSLDAFEAAERIRERKPGRRKGAPVAGHRRKKMPHFAGIVDPGVAVFDPTDPGDKALPTAPELVPPRMVMQCCHRAPLDLNPLLISISSAQESKRMKASAERRQQTADSRSRMVSTLRKLRRRQGSTLSPLLHLAGIVPYTGTSGSTSWPEHERAARCSRTLIRHHEGKPAAESEAYILPLAWTLAHVGAPGSARACLLDLVARIHNDVSPEVRRAIFLLSDPINVGSDDKIQAALQWLRSNPSPGPLLSLAAMILPLDPLDADVPLDDPASDPSITLFLAGGLAFHGVGSTNSTSMLDLLGAVGPVVETSLVHGLPLPAVALLLLLESLANMAASRRLTPLGRALRKLRPKRIDQLRQSATRAALVPLSRIAERADSRRGDSTASDEMRFEFISWLKHLQLVLTSSGTHSNWAHFTPGEDRFQALLSERGPVFMALGACIMAHVGLSAPAEAWAAAIHPLGCGAACATLHWYGLLTDPSTLRRAR